MDAHMQQSSILLATSAQQHTSHVKPVAEQVERTGSAATNSNRARSTPVEQERSSWSHRQHAARESISAVEPIDPESVEQEQEQVFVVLPEDFYPLSHSPKNTSIYLENARDEEDVGNATQLSTTRVAVATNALDSRDEAVDLNALKYLSSVIEQVERHRTESRNINMPSQTAVVNEEIRKELDSISLRSSTEPQLPSISPSSSSGFISTNELPSVFSSDLLRTITSASDTSAAPLSNRSAFSILAQRLEDDNLSFSDLLTNAEAALHEFRDRYAEYGDTLLNEGKLTYRELRATEAGSAMQGQLKTIASNWSKFLGSEEGRCALLSLPSLVSSLPSSALLNSIVRSLAMSDALHAIYLRLNNSADTVDWLAVTNETAEALRDFRTNKNLKAISLLQSTASFLRENESTLLPSTVIPSLISDDYRPIWRAELQRVLLETVTAALKSITIDAIEGQTESIRYKIGSLSLEDLQVSAEDVNLSISEDEQPSPQDLKDDCSLWCVEFNVNNIKCKATDVSWVFQQLNVPYFQSSGIADIKLADASIHFKLLLETSSVLKLHLASVSLSVPSLNVHTKRTPLATVYNTILKVASKPLRDYAEKAIDQHLHKKILKWIGSVNELLANLDARSISNYEVNDLSLPPPFIPLTEDPPPPKSPFVASSSSSIDLAPTETKYTNKTSSIQWSFHPNTPLSSRTGANGRASPSTSRTPAVRNPPSASSLVVPYDITMGF